MPGSTHDDDESNLPVSDHDSCVSRQEFRILRNMVRDMAGDVKLMKDVLMVSTPERGCMLDTQRKQDAEIALLRTEIAVVKASSSAPTAPLSRRLVETIALTSASTITVLTIALLGKGIVVSIMTEALKLAGGAK